MWPVMDNAPQYSKLMFQYHATDNDTSRLNADGVTQAYIHARYRSDVLLCPTRGFRTTAAGISGANSGRPDEPTIYGQAVDYLPVSVVYRASDWISNSPKYAGSSNPDKPYLMGAIVGIRRETVHNNGGITTYQMTSAVTIGGVTDGMTYTLIAGEKHVPSGFLGNSRADYPPYAASLYSDSSAWHSNKIIGLGLPPRPDDPAFDFENPLPDESLSNLGDSYESKYTMFGSWHPGVTQFVFGDSRVVAIKNFVEPLTLQYAGHRSDGQSYNLP